MRVHARTKSLDHASVGDDVFGPGDCSAVRLNFHFPTTRKQRKKGREKKSAKCKKEKQKRDKFKTQNAG